MRLDKFLCAATQLTRRDAHRCIKNGLVAVDGQVVQDPGLQIESEQVTLDDEVIRLPEPVYLMLHKPAGYVCANTDGLHPTVLDLLPRDLHPTEPLQIVGRLDLDTTGLLLLTTDGQWNHRVTAPNSRCDKVYWVELAEPITQESVSELEQGVLLRSEEKPTLPCQIEILTPNQVRIRLREGRYHQVKRMFAAVGNHVAQLRRESIGSLTLDPSLQPGEFRHLTQDEVRSL